VARAAGSKRKNFQQPAASVIMSRQQQKKRQQTESKAVTETESHTLMKNLFFTTFSSICYLRNLFPADCFMDKKITGKQSKHTQLC
jgi:hypothetical protein